MHDALGTTRGSRRVEDGRRERCQLERRNRGCGRDLRLVAVADDEHRAVGVGRDRGRNVLHEIGVRDEGSGAGVREEVVELVRLEVPVHRDDRCTQLVGRGPDLEELDPVREHDRDAIVDTDTTVREHARGPRRALVERRVRDDVPVADEGGPVRLQSRPRADAPDRSVVGHGAASPKISSSASQNRRRNWRNTFAEAP